MTTETRDQLPRRAFLAAATAVSLAAASGLVITGSPRASAATGADVTWRISSEPADARTGYAAMIQGVRQAVRAGRVDSMGGAPIDITDRTGTSQYVSVDIHAEDRSEVIRVFLRRSDLYVMGWRQGVETGGGGVTWDRYFTLDPAAAPTGSAPLPGITTATTNNRFQDLASYSALAQQGATRDGMQISPGSLNTAVLRLQAGESIDLRLAAQSILQIIVGVAEASRFRQQAIDTSRAFYNGVVFGLTTTHMAFHNNWSALSRATLLAVIGATAVFAEPVVIAGIVIGTTVVAAQYLMTAHHSDLDTKGRHLGEGSLLYVSQDGIGDHWTVQAAIDAVPDAGPNSILIEKGTYHEVISVPSSKSWLTIEGVTSNRNDVVIHNTRCHGMINPATGQKWGTQGSAVATFRGRNLTVKDLTISNTFDRAAHPEIDPYETQAVAIAAMGDRQVYENVSIMSHQDTLLCKGVNPTDQARQYFYECFIRGDVDFIFGNATAVIDRSDISMVAWPGGTVMAPNTDYRKKYGILLTGSNIFSTNAPDRSMHLGRPWHNTADAWPQAGVRNCTINGHINAEQPWTNMVPDYPWQWARFWEYKNGGVGNGIGSNAPKLTDAQAADYTAQKYLAGTDGWNPVR